MTPADRDEAMNGLRAIFSMFLGALLMLLYGACFYIVWFMEGP